MGERVPNRPTPIVGDTAISLSSRVRRLYRKDLPPFSIDSLNPPHESYFPHCIPVPLYWNVVTAQPHAHSARK